MRRARRAGAGRAVALLLAAGALGLAGRASLPAPPLHRPDELAGWVAALGPAGVAMAIVRATAMGVAAILGTATAVAVAWGARGDDHRLEALAGRLPRPAWRLVRGLAGISVTAGISVAGAGGATPHVESDRRPAPAEATMHRLPAAPGETVHRAPGGPVEWMRLAPDPGEARLRALPDDGDPATARLRSLDDPAGRWTVEPGESFWSISVAHLTDRWGRPPSAAEVAPYWAELVELNRSRLVTGDPDLLYPGQELQLVPVPG